MSWLRLSTSVGVPLLLLVAAAVFPLLAVAQERHVSPKVFWTTPVFGGVNATFGDPTVFTMTTTSGKLRCLTVYVCEPNATATLLVLNVRNGAVVWQRPVNTTLPQASGWIAAGQGGLFAGTATGVAAFDAATGDSLWEYTLPSANVVPAHTTYAAGRVFFTFENGHKSGSFTILNATTGALLYVAKGEVAITLPWIVNAGAGGVAYCAYNASYPPGQRVAVVLRSFSGVLRWAHRGLQHAPPGLWDNPNLDVDSKGRSVFMYSKINNDLRVITSFDSITGAVQWTLPSNFSIVDYDTYAWGGNFYRLFTVSPTAMQIQRVWRHGHIKWTTQFNCTDPNAILLVDGGGVFVFGLNTNQILGFEGEHGRPLWSILPPNPSVWQPTTGITDKVDGHSVLMWGSGTGRFHAVLWRS